MKEEDAKNIVLMAMENLLDMDLIRLNNVERQEFLAIMNIEIEMGLKKAGSIQFIALMGVLRSLGTYKCRLSPGVVKTDLVATVNDRIDVYLEELKM